MSTLASQRNGNGRLTNRLFTKRRISLAPAAITHSFTAEDTTQEGIPIRMGMPKILVGLGTTGSKVTRSCIATFHREIGRLPNAVGYLNVDADVDGARHARGHTVEIGIDGAGTDPVNGRKIFHKHRDRIRGALLAHLEGLFIPDPELTPESPAKRCTSFVVVAGCGGTSGGCLDPMISMIHDVARRKHIAEPRVYVVLIGPKISINDIRRSVMPQQAAIIRDTFAQNLRRFYSDLAFDRTIRMERENGTTFTLRSTDRVFSLQIVDESNGQSDISVTDDLVSMLAESVFLQHFTNAGMNHDARFCDWRTIGAYTGTAY